MAWWLDERKNLSLKDFKELYENDDWNKILEKEEIVQRKRGPKPGTEAAKRGGNAVKAKYGEDFFAKIGRKGGNSIKDSSTPDFYAEIGKKGGDTTKEKHGREHYIRIGRIGGSR